MSQIDASRTWLCEVLNVLGTDNFVLQQRYIARATGISEETISHWATNKAVPTRTQLQKLFHFILTDTRVNIYGRFDAISKIVFYYSGIVLTPRDFSPWSAPEIWLELLSESTNLHHWREVEGDSRMIALQIIAATRSRIWRALLRYPPKKWIDVILRKAEIRTAPLSRMLEISRHTVTAWRTGKNKPNLENTMRLATAIALLSKNRMYTVTFLEIAFGCGFTMTKEDFQGFRRRSI